MVAAQEEEGNQARGIVVFAEAWRPQKEESRTDQKCNTQVERLSGRAEPGYSTARIKDGEDEEPRKSARSADRSSDEGDILPRNAQKKRNPGKI